MKCALIALLLLCAAPALANDPIEPNAAMTPGAVMTTDANVVCHRSTQSVRNVPESEKLAVYREYGITEHRPGQYEIDHLISLELGGSNDISNLWPQSYVTQPWNAHVKDHLENRLHALVCAGKLNLGDAQHAIATDWIAAYKQYVGPEPTPAPAPLP